MPALAAASDLLARYGKLASAGVSAYHADSDSMQSSADEESAREAPKRQAPAPVQIGAQLHVLSPSQHWRSARVEDTEAGQLLVHYDGYEHKYDEWIPAHSTRIRGMQNAALKYRKAAAEKQVAQEFAHYAQVAVSGQNAYTHDAAAAAAGTKWDNHRQYVEDEIRGHMKAEETSARYSRIASLGTPEQAAHAVPAPVKSSQTTAPAKTITAGKTPKLSVVQAAARAAAKAAATVVDEAREAVEEVAGTHADQKPVHKERAPEQMRAKSGGAQHGRGRLGDSTDRTYAEVGHMLSLAETTAKAEGNAAVKKQVEQEQHTLAKLRNVPGKLPERVQHNLVSAGASLLRRLGIGAGASAIPQSRPLTANSDNAVLAETSASEGSAVAKQRAMLHLHRLHARA